MPDRSLETAEILSRAVVRIRSADLEEIRTAMRNDVLVGVLAYSYFVQANSDGDENVSPRVVLTALADAVPDEDEWAGLFKEMVGLLGELPE